MSILLETNLSLPLFKRGKVRDVYDLGDKLLIVSTDRISAFDYVLPCGVPEKGRILNQLSAFWFKKTAHIIPNHFIKVIDSLDSLRHCEGRSAKAISIGELPDYLTRRSMLTAKAHRIPVECVVRGYLSGSAWAEYKQSGSISNIHLPSGMPENQELPQPIFTPTTKSDVEHDRPLTNDDVVELGIEHLMAEMERKSLLIYRFAQDYAKTRGIITPNSNLVSAIIMPLVLA